ncbi:MAG: glycosyltransferase [Solirubrobacteraceae bacterium]|nr:glycosyltransferase [Solirubrobacteraceae bacterium]
MPRSPRVTVVVPMHDSGARLDETLESIVAQTFDDWEAVLVDDASTDDTLARAQAFARREPRMRVVALRCNAGVAGARNAAIAASRGELVALLDHDDRWRENYLARCVELLDGARAAGGRPAIVACDALVETPAGIAAETYAARLGAIDEVGLDEMIERNCICARALFTRAAYDEVGGFSTACPGYDDYDLWLRMLEAGHEVVTTREPLAVYRLHDANLSSDAAGMSEGALATYGRALRRGALTAGQRRVVRARMRHYRALRERAVLRRAVAERRPLHAVKAAARAAPYGLVAFLQDPSRWGEWLAPARRRLRRRAARITSS